MENREIMEVLKWFSDMGISDVMNATPPRSSKKKISTLADLKKAMYNIDIPIKYCATNMVFGMGNEKADILLLGSSRS